MPDGAALLRVVRIFVSSPGDVSDERAIVSLVADRLQYDPFVRGRVAIDLVAWDRPGAGIPMLASTTPQASVDAGLPLPSQCDIVVVVLWSRIGTPLPHPAFQRSDGSAYESGTVWELENAIEAARAGGRPGVLLYRRTEKVLFDIDAPDFEDRRAQKRSVDALFDRFRDPTTGALLVAYTAFATPDEFQRRLESDLRALVQRLLDTGPQTAAPPEAQDAVRAWPGSPFPGLRSFTDADAPIYFGRGRETDQLARRVAESRFVAVVGASGSGKSSLVGAGLLPRLGAGATAPSRWLLPSFSPEANQWTGLRFTPGELGGDPLLALAVKLAPLVSETPRTVVNRLRADPAAVVGMLDQAAAGHDASDVLVFVDQFEELFTVVDPAQRDPFVEVLAAAAGSEHGRVVLTVRSDSYHRCVELPALAELFEQGQLPLSTPTDTLLDMIVRPAELAALDFEEGLPGRLLHDTGQGPGALPLLAFALDELHRAAGDDRRLTFAAYEAMGGVQGAIGVRAEHVFEYDLDHPARTAFGPVFRELVEIDEDGRPARRRAGLARLTADAGARTLIDVFTDARLLVQSGGPQEKPSVSVAHEALFLGWSRLI